MDYEFLNTILASETPSSRESIRSGTHILGEYLQRFGYDVWEDPYKSLVVRRPVLRNANKRTLTVLLDAHVDEVAFKIISVDDQGFLSIAPIGGMDIRLMPGAQMKILTGGSTAGPNKKTRSKKRRTNNNSGVTIVHGIIGSKSIHLQDDDDGDTNADIDHHKNKWEDLWVDIGVRSRTEALQKINLGDTMVFAAESFWLSPSRLCGRALDNKVGCFILTQVLRELSKDEDLGVDLIGTFTTQEEVNLCGSQFLSNLIDPSPDYTIVVDVGASTDHPGVNEKKFGTQTLGGGPFIDVGPNDNEVLVKQLILCAETKGIPLQPNHAASGSTNMTSYFNKGIPGVSVGVVGRYLHTAVTCIDRADIEACVRLLVEFLRSKGAVDSARLFHPMLRPWKL